MQKKKNKRGTSNSPQPPFESLFHKWRIASLCLISRMKHCPLPTTALFFSPVATSFLFHGEQMPRSTRRINSGSRRGFEDSEMAPVTVTRNVRYRTLSPACRRRNTVVHSAGAHYGWQPWVVLKVGMKAIPSPPKCDKDIFFKNNFYELSFFWLTATEILSCDKIKQMKTPTNNRALGGCERNEMSL